MVCAIKECVNDAIKRGMCSTHWKRWSVGNYVIEIDKTRGNKGSVEDKMERFTKRTSSGCLEWTGPKSKNGYGRMFYEGVRMPAHRATYLHHHGPIKPKNEIHHKCANRLCIEITHLESLTPYQHSLTKPRDERGRIVAHASS